MLRAPLRFTLAAEPVLRSLHGDRFPVGPACSLSATARRVSFEPEPDNRVDRLRGDTHCTTGRTNGGQFAATNHLPHCGRRQPQLFGHLDGPQELRHCVLLALLFTSLRATWSITATKYECHARTRWGRGVDDR